VVTYPGLRPGVVPAWFSLDARASYRVFGWARLGFQVSNLLDSHGQLVKGGDFPFDYRVEGRRILGTLEAEL
jgi:iron complex outermembrane receptor protein